MSEQPPGWSTGRLLSTVARRVERAWDEHLEHWQLSHASLPVLAMLTRGEHSQRDLASAMSVTEQTMSRMLARLQRAGYLTRRRDPGDRRRRVVALLPRGTEVLSAASDPERVEALATAGLEPNQVAALRDALVTMVRAMDRDEAESGSPHPLT